MTESSPRRTARIAGVFYLLVFVLGGAAFAARGSLGTMLNLGATACYVVVTALFYELFKPVHRGLALTAALFSLVGCAIGGSGAGDTALVFFGFYCLLTGALIVRSGFLPKVTGIGMIIAGTGWLTFLWPPLAHALAPFNMLPGVLGEGILTFWLLTAGVDAQRWTVLAEAQP